MLQSLLPRDRLARDDILDLDAVGEIILCAVLFPSGPRVCHTAFTLETIPGEHYSIGIAGRVCFGYEQYFIPLFGLGLPLVEPSYCAFFAPDSSTTKSLEPLCACLTAEIKLPSRLIRNTSRLKGYIFQPHHVVVQASEIGFRSFTLNRRLALLDNKVPAEL
jgi:hypothetical protein